MQWLVLCYCDFLFYIYKTLKLEHNAYSCLYRKDFFYFSYTDTVRCLSQNRFTLNRFGEAWNNGSKSQHVYFGEHSERDF